MNNFKVIKPSMAEINSWSMNSMLNPSNMVNVTVLASAAKLEALREEYRSKNLLVPSYTALIMKAVSGVLKKHPEMNRAVIGFPFFKKIVQFGSFDINVAVEKKLENIPGQAYAPTIREVDKKSLIQITEELKFYANCDEKSDKHFALFLKILKYVPWPLAYFILNFPSQIPNMWARHRGCACWVNSPSKSGADLVFTYWPWPITFSFGVVKKRPFVVADQVVSEDTIPLLMVFDRRIMGGGPAGRIFADFKKIIEEGDPEVFG